MEFQQLLQNIFERASQYLEGALDGLTQEDLNRLPNPDCNSIGWLTWHLTRVQDSAVSGFMGKEQIWITDRWCSKFNRDPDPKDVGFGHSSEDVANFQSPDTKTLLDYHYAVQRQTKEYISKLSTTELGRETNNPRNPTIGLRLAAIINDNLQHTGQVAYLRGLFKGKG